MHPKCTRVSPHQGRKIVLKSNVYPLNKTIINGTWRQRKISTDIIHCTANGLWVDERKLNYSILIVKCNKSFSVLKLLLEKSFKIKMHTSVTGKFYFFLLS